MRPGALLCPPAVTESGEVDLTSRCVVGQNARSRSVTFLFRAGRCRGAGVPERAGETSIRRDELVAAPGGESSETGPWVSHTQTRRQVEQGQSKFLVLARRRAGGGRVRVRRFRCERRSEQGDHLSPHELDTNPYVADLPVGERRAERSRQAARRPVRLGADAEGAGPEVGRHHPRVR